MTLTDKEKSGKKKFSNLTENYDRNNSNYNRYNIIFTNWVSFIHV